MSTKAIALKTATVAIVKGKLGNQNKELKEAKTLKLKRLTMYGPWPIHSLPQVRT